MINVLIAITMFLSGLITPETYIPTKASANEAIAGYANELGIDRTIHFQFLSPSRAPYGWTAASDGYVNIIANPLWLNENFEWYGSPLFLQSLAHEVCHISGIKSEAGAELCGLDLAPSNARNIELQKSVVMAIIALEVEQGRNPTSILTGLNLPSNQFQWYAKYIDHCNKDLKDCTSRANEYILPFLQHFFPQFFNRHNPK